MNFEDRHKLLKVYRRLGKTAGIKSGLAGIINKLKRISGLSLRKTEGCGSSEVCFSAERESRYDATGLVININAQKAEGSLKTQLAENLLKAATIRFRFKTGRRYDENQRALIMEYIEQIQPEAMTLFPLCRGKGIDVGCGYRKTHPEAIGVDWVAKGQPGRAGNVAGMASAGDVQTSGDDLNMFEDDSLDYVVSRHNLEHYRNPEKTLREWIRVLRPGGLMGIIVPDSTNPATAEETHYYNFTKENFRGMVEKSGCLTVLDYGVCLANWSFYCIARKKGSGV